MTRPLASLGKRRRSLLVGLVNVLDGEDGQVAVVAEIAQGYPGAGLERELVDGGLVDVQGDGHAKERATGEPVLLDNSGGGEMSVSAPIEEPIVLGLV